MNRASVRPLLFAAWVLACLVAAWPASGQRPGPAPTYGKVALFAAGGVRQDTAEAVALQGIVPVLASLLQNGTRADGGMLAQAPAGAGAGWQSLATGAWPGVHGGPGDTISINGGPFANHASTLDPGVLQAETLAQAVERAGRKVALIEWPGGRAGAIDGPTVDGRSAFSGRGVATNYIAASDNANRVAAFGVQFDHPAGFAGQPPFAAAAPAPANGWTNVPASLRPPMEMRLRIIDAGVDKYGLNAYLYASGGNTRPVSTIYDRVVLSPTKNGAAPGAVILAPGQWADLRVVLSGGPLDGKSARVLVKVEKLANDLSQVRLYHSAVVRANATWPGWSESGFSGDFEEYLAQRFPASAYADSDLVATGVVGEETFVEQALKSQDFVRPVVTYVAGKHQPDLLMAGARVVDDVQAQFLSLVTPSLPNGAANPAYDDAQVNGTPDGRVAARTSFLQNAFKAVDGTLKVVQGALPAGADLFVVSGHGAAPSFLALDASKPLVDLGLLSKPQTANCRVAVGETIGKAKACWSGGAVQVYLNLAGRDPAGGGLQQVAANAEATTVAQIKSALLALTDPNDWTGDGQPEGWQVTNRAFTKAESRYVPIGNAATSDMAHPTRTGDVVAFAAPPYQFERATPGTPFARAPFFGQGNYAPDIASAAGNASMRGVFAAGGNLVRTSYVAPNLRTVDVAPTVAYLLGVPMPQQAQGRVRLDVLRNGSGRTVVPVIGFTDYHGQLDPTSVTMDGLNVSVGGAARLATMFDEERAQLSGAALLASGDNVGASPPNSLLLNDIPAIDVLNAWGTQATAYGNHEFDYGLARLQQHRSRATFPFLGANIVDAMTLANPVWVKGTQVFVVNGVQVGVIGIALKSTPDYVRAGATAGLVFQDELQAIRVESARLKTQGIRVQAVLIHDGTDDGMNRIGTAPDVDWDGPIIDIANALQDTSVDVVFAGHTHRSANTMVGRILVVQGQNAGASYSTVQMVVNAQEVEWAGGATRVAKGLGVAERADVAAIVNAANAQTAIERNRVIGTQQFDILRDPPRINESAMGNLVADALRARYPGVEAALVNSGSLRADLRAAPPSAGEQPGEITWGEVFAVLPFGNGTVVETLTGAQLVQAFLNGVSPHCDPLIATGRFPQVSGLVLSYTCVGTTPVINGVWKAPNGPMGTLTPIGPTDTVRIVTNDFMFSGGDGYVVLSGGTDVIAAGDDLLWVTVDHITAHSPVGPVVEGRIVKSP